MQGYWPALTLSANLQRMQNHLDAYEHALAVEKIAAAQLRAEQIGCKLGAEMRSASEELSKEPGKMGIKGLCSKSLAELRQNLGRTKFLVLEVLKFLPVSSLVSLFCYSYSFLPLHLKRQNFIPEANFDFGSLWPSWAHTSVKKQFIVLIAFLIPDAGVLQEETPMIVIKTHCPSLPHLNLQVVPFFSLLSLEARIPAPNTKSASGYKFCLWQILMFACLIIKGSLEETSELRTVQKRCDWIVKSITWDVDWIVKSITWDVNWIVK